MKIAVIHDTDNDGYMSAAIIQSRYGAGLCDFFPARSYDQERLRSLPGLVRGYDTVYMVDTSAPLDIMDALENQAGKDFLWFDHHASASDMFGAYQGRQELGKSACRLVYEWLHPGEDLPDAVDYTDRYDLFEGQDRFDFRSTIIPFQCVMERIRSVRAYRQVLVSGSEDIWNLIEIGTRLWEDEQSAFDLVEKKFLWYSRPNWEASKNYHLVITKALRNPGRVAWMLRQNGSKDDFYINQNLNDGKFTHSLRSLHPEADCLQFIKEIGVRGGGHPQAAGFSTEFDLFT